ncbi:MAG: type II toxin-antitoxin system RelB/DinJ family antitoxin [Defluviitaleaceae bacterium]|nr:type II toxin-antitoxin system RelB/DinJ family antitoxin [Defluviitaleaceae bacterium]
MAQSMVNFRMEDDLKKGMERACKDMGMSMTAAFTIFATKVSKERRIPFEVTADPDPQRQAFMEKQKVILQKLIKNIDADPLSDDPLDEMLNRRVNIARDLDL